MRHQDVGVHYFGPNPPRVIANTADRAKLYGKIETIRREAKHMKRKYRFACRISISNEEFLENSRKANLWHEVWLEAAYVGRRIERGEL